MRLMVMEQTSGRKTPWKKYVIFGLFAWFMIILPVAAVSGQVTGIWAQQTGSVALSSVPYQTTVSLDNRQTGVTPETITGISPGVHTVLLTCPGFLPYSQQITVQAGSVTRVYAILIPKPQDAPSTGAVTISSSPTEAIIYIDSQLAGVSPTTIDGIPGGVHHVLLMKQGFANYNAPITVTNGTTTDVYAVLNPVPVTAPPSGSVRIISTPSAASIYLDNRLIGVTPTTVDGIPGGVHQVLLMKQGFANYNAQITVTNGTTTDVYAVLNPVPVTAPSSGSVRIASTPSAASVYLDNRLTGVTPETINGVSPGQHQLLIQKPGYLGVTKTITITNGQVTAVTVVLPVNPAIYY